jgi:hypothetical protein
MLDWQWYSDIPNCQRSRGSRLCFLRKPADEQREPVFVSPVGGVAEAHEPAARVITFPLNQDAIIISGCALSADSGDAPVRGKGRHGALAGIRSPIFSPSGGHAQIGSQPGSRDPNRNSAGAHVLS